MWICKKCNEENEDSFDTCYKCLTYSEEGAMKCNELPQKDDNKILTSNLHRFVLCRASSGHKHAVDEMLSGEGVRGKIEDVKVRSCGERSDDART